MDLIDLKRNLKQKSSSSSTSGHALRAPSDLGSLSDRDLQLLEELAEMYLLWQYENRKMHHVPNSRWKAPTENLKSLRLLLFTVKAGDWKKKEASIYEAIPFAQLREDVKRVLEWKLEQLAADASR